MTASTETVKAKAARGVASFAVTTVAKYGLSLVRIAILARLLAPEAFGLLGLAIAAIRGLETVAALGPDKLIIQQKTITSELVQTIWTFRAVLGVVVGVVAVGLAVVFDRVSGVEGSGEVLAVVAVASIIKGVKSPGALLAERELRFSQVALFELAMTAAEVIVVVVLAVTVGGAAALAWGVVVAAALEVVVSYVVFRTVVRPGFSRQHAKEVLGVGGHFLIISLGSFVMVQGDNYIVGAMLGATLLGQYLVAYRLCELPLQLTQQVTTRVSLSAFSRVQGDDAAKRQGFLKSLDLQLALLVPASAGLFALADGLINTLFGPVWEPAIPCLRALGLVMLGRGFSNIVAPFLIANGHFAYASRVKVVEAAVFVVGVIVGVSAFGIVGAAVGAGVGYLVAGALRVVYLVRWEGLPADALLRAFGAVLAATAPAAAAGYAVDVALPAHPAVRLAVGIVTFAAAYSGATLVFRSSLVAEARAAAQGLRRRRANA